MNGSTDQYYVRASLNTSSGSYTTSPVENTIRTDILLLQYLSNISTNAQTLVVPEKLWPIMMGIPVGLWFYGKKRKQQRIKQNQYV